MSFNETTINYMRITNTLETLSNNQNLLFNILLSIKNNISNMNRYRERTPNNTTNTARPDFNSFYSRDIPTSSYTNRVRTPPVSIPPTIDTPALPSENIFTRLRNIEISLTEPVVSNIFGILNNLDPPNDTITIDNLLQNTQLVVYNESLDINNTCSICRVD